jgi:hypothetical protein
MKPAEEALTTGYRSPARVKGPPVLMNPETRPEQIWRLLSLADQEGLRRALVRVGCGLINRTAREVRDE